MADSLREVEKKEIDPKTGEIKILKVQEKVPMYIETWSRFDYAVTGSKRQEAKIVGDDPLTDVAILQVVDTRWVPAAAAPFAPDDYDYMRGRVVFAVGNARQSAHWYSTAFGMRVVGLRQDPSKGAEGADEIGRAHV